MPSTQLTILTIEHDGFPKCPYLSQQGGNRSPIYTILIQLHITAIPFDLYFYCNNSLMGNGKILTLRLGKIVSEFSNNIKYV